MAEFPTHYPLSPSHRGVAQGFEPTASWPYTRLYFQKRYHCAPRPAPSQLLLFWIAACVYTAVLDQFIESKPTNVAYNLYISVSIAGSSLSFTGALIEQFCTRGLYWAKISFMLYSALYVAALPTLIAAMTSYIAMSVPMIMMRDDSLIDWRDVSSPVYSNNYILNCCTDGNQSDRYVYGISLWIWAICCLLQSI